LVVVVAVLLPVTAIILTALTRAWGLLPTFDNLTLENFRYVLFDLRLSQRAIRNSLFLAVTAATATMLIGTVISYVVIKTRIRGRKLLDLLGTMPYSVPGTVFALGMIIAWNRAFWGRLNIYNTILIILVAYIARYLAFSLRTVGASLHQVAPALEESARVSGASWFQSLKDIVLPLIKPGIAAGWLLVFMPTLRELTISILLWSAGNETIGVVVYNLNSAGQVTASAALATLMIAVILILNGLVKRLTGGKYGY
jgi:iron(III) transport system permease protein